MSLKLNKPMVFKRKDIKSHGTKNLVEGIFKTGDNCLIIDDVITSGTSILETIDVKKNITKIVIDYFYSN